MYLTWDQHLTDISYDPLLITVCDGLREDVHPYVTMARLAWKDMLSCPVSECLCVLLVCVHVAYSRTCTWTGG